MRVLMFGWEFPPHITGGLGTACYGLTRALAKQGTEIIFVVPKAYGDEDQRRVRLVSAEDIEVSHTSKNLEEFWRNIKYLEISSNIVPYVDPEEYKRIVEYAEKEVAKYETVYTKKKFRFSGKYGPNLMSEVTRYAITAASIAWREKFDVIHAHDWLTYPAGIAAKMVSGKPLVIHVHATEFDRSGENINQSVYNIERRGMEVADTVITVSNYTRNIVINRYGINPEKVITVHNAVHFVNRIEEEFERGVDEKVVTFLGRVTFQKGPDYFVEAANKVLKRTQNVRFVMAGSGDMLNRMIRRVAQLGIAPRFHFTGFLKGNEVNQMFALSDVYVMPSVSEPFGISPLEAMRSNVPVIISKQSGVAEVLRHAIKVDFWDIDALADSIYGLLNYKALSEFFIKHGQEEVNNMKWDRAAGMINEIYNKLANK
ncbi:glycosyltransferase family 4 protein [Tenuifilum thalassicum]|uniref:starch synthase n=1 Tax=Tenuifilum thalassicum TaxID=2590900 RepID=A0A7D4BQZ5_9BACT|nr:glycosyltransferase family 4 protein [Tenuifilum thalassicum]QKG79281.1 glycosyltransferase family 4 protein [Tenuifilum thalassicum]